MNRIAPARWVGLPAIGRNLLSRRRALDWRDITAFGLPLVLYLLTLAPTIYNLDSAELTTAAATGGITRSTGYPLYLMLGYLWTFLPVGDVGYRMNLFSAFCGALTIALADRILRRLDVGRWAAFGALGLLACAPYFWALSLIAEVYMLQTALMAGLILLLLRWAERPTPGRLAAVGLLAGLSLCHHAMTVLLIPGCLWFVLTTAPQRAFAPRALLPTLGAMLLGLCAFVYLPLRYAAQPAFNYAGLYDSFGVFRPVDLQTPDGLWWLISGRAFAGLMLSYSGDPLWHEIVQYARYLVQAFFVVGVGPGLLGLAVLLRRDWRLGGMLLLMFVVNAAFYIDYRVGDKQTMYLPTYLIWTIWLAVGYQWLLDWLSDPETPASRQIGVWVVRGAIAALALLAVGWNWRLVDLSDDWSTRTRGEEILRAAGPDALVLGYWQTVPPVQYLQMVEGWRPDVQAINRFLIPPGDAQALILREIDHRPIYIDSIPSALLQQVSYRPVGGLYQLCPRRSDDAFRKEVVGCP
jgi:hypothetical protein